MKAIWFLHSLVVRRTPPDKVEIRCRRCWGEPPVGRLLVLADGGRTSRQLVQGPASLSGIPRANLVGDSPPASGADAADHRARIIGVRWPRKFLAACTHAV